MIQHRTVLLGDDDTRAREQLRDILRASRCSVVGTANNTDDLLYKFEQLRPDAVVVDVTLFGTMDPLLAIRRMRRLSPGVSIFAVGSMSQNMVMMEALTEGAADFFIKPLHRRSVRQILERNLG